MQNYESVGIGSTEIRQNYSINKTVYYRNNNCNLIFFHGNEWFKYVYTITTAVGMRLRLNIIIRTRGWYEGGATTSFDYRLM